MTSSETFGFSWDFLDEIGWWALGLTIASALLGAALTRDTAFAVGCLFAGGVDFVMVRLAVGRGRREVAEGRADAVAPTVMVAGRLVVKAAILVLALAMPDVVGFVGAVVGALMYDVTLAVVGSVIAVSRTMNHTNVSR